VAGRPPAYLRDQENWAAMRSEVWRDGRTSYSGRNVVFTAIYDAHGEIMALQCHNDSTEKKGRGGSAATDAHMARLIGSVRQRCDTFMDLKFNSGPGTRLGGAIGYSTRK